MPTALLGFAPSKHSRSHQVLRPYGPLNPHDDWLASDINTAAIIRQRKPHLLGFAPGEHVWRSNSPEASPCPVAPLGFFPSRVLPKPALALFWRSSSHALSPAELFSSRQDMHFRVSMSRSWEEEVTRVITFLHYPCRVFAPASSPTFRHRHTGLWVHLISGRTLLPWPTDA
jgi:hypothetical protein